MRRAIAAIACVIALGLVDFSIAKKERLLSEGRLVYLELAPVDPRSLMQGDYMALRYKLANEVAALLTHEQSSSGRVVVALDASSVAHFKRLHDGGPIGADEALLFYRVRDGTLKFATNAFFFQEGHAQDYAKARFGEFRVAADGELLLTGLQGESLEPLGLARQ
jgi:uncharacterized membrane-anchored protein